MSQSPWNQALAGRILERAKVLAARVAEENKLVLSNQKAATLLLNCLMMECQIAIITLTGAGHVAEKEGIDHLLSSLMDLFMQDRAIPKKYFPKMNKLAQRHLGKTWRLALFPEDPQSEEAFGKSVIGRTIFYVLKSFPIFSRKKQFEPVLKTVSLWASDALEMRVYLTP